ncbi:hypothetical protein EUX98_g1620 [Antrodiella citrinella]|uniref:protein-tyrosine-phosphatase n=1 Tax=Antrodiella citrinella TaxID=2447956 RepID=A0A4S4N414_9APHY|nr:hypothetical protein EUX98_g1620 [Antrodiella citrinella]
MNEIIPGLWLGNLGDAYNVTNLRAHGIHSIVSALPGKVHINEVRIPLFARTSDTENFLVQVQTFTHLHIEVTDTDDTDILTHFIPVITFIQKELDKRRGVLVHCFAGISRSATLVAAYLMYTRGLDPADALKHIRQYRSNVNPNEGFLIQLDIFHKSAFLL